MNPNAAKVKKLPRESTWEQCESASRDRSHGASHQCLPKAAGHQSTGTGKNLRDQLKVVMLTREVAELRSQIETLTSVMDIDELRAELAAKLRVREISPSSAALRLWAEQSTPPDVADEPEPDGVW